VRTELQSKKVINKTAKVEEEKERQLELKIPRAETKKGNESKIIEEVSQLREKYSGLILQKQVLDEGSSMEFIPLE